MNQSYVYQPSSQLSPNHTKSHGTTSKNFNRNKLKNLKIFLHAFSFFKKKTQYKQIYAYTKENLAIEKAQNRERKWQQAYAATFPSLSNPIHGERPKHHAPASWTPAPWSGWRCSAPPAAASSTDAAGAGPWSKPPSRPRRAACLRPHSRRAATRLCPAAAAAARGSWLRLRRCTVLGGTGRLPRPG
jgi:hypothetical protein